MSLLIKLTRTINFLEQFIIMHVCTMYVYNLLCMIEARIRWCNCRVGNILTLGKLLSLWFCFLLHSILFWISQTSYRTYKIISSYELARPIMGTIFLVGRAKRAPHWGVQSRFRVIYVCMCVCGGPKSVGGITWAKRAHAQSQYWAVKSDQ